MLEERHLTAEGYVILMSFCQTKTGYSGVLTAVKEGILTPSQVQEGFTTLLSRDTSDVSSTLPGFPFMETVLSKEEVGYHVRDREFPFTVFSASAIITR